MKEKLFTDIRWRPYTMTGWTTDRWSYDNFDFDFAVQSGVEIQQRELAWICCRCGMETVRDARDRGCRHLNRWKPLPNNDSMNARPWTVKGIVFWDMTPCGSSKKKDILEAPSSGQQDSWVLPARNENVPPERLFFLVDPHDVINQKTTSFIVTTEKSTPEESSLRSCMTVDDLCL
jgi:hypothetical protein